MSPHLGKIPPGRPTAWLGIAGHPRADLAAEELAHILVDQTVHSVRTAHDGHAPRVGAGLGVHSLAEHDGTDKIRFGIRLYVTVRATEQEA
ncbi:hypothetical protein BAY59_11620 [Prauserella coralliicola]|nr:hypothetical protein BAY59_11620 [Prauserella coralliicola]